MEKREFIKPPVRVPPMTQAQFKALLSSPGLKGMEAQKVLKILQARGVEVEGVGFLPKESKAAPMVKAALSSVGSGENLTGTAWEKGQPAPEGYRTINNVWGETGLVKEDLGFGNAVDFAMNTAKQGFEGVKNIAGGLYEQGKEMIGMDSDQNVSGEGFSQAFGGVLQLIGAPLQAAAKEIPMGEPVLEVVSKILNSPAELGGFLWEKAWEASGKDVNDPAFQQGKRQVVDALSVGTMLATPKITEKAKGVSNKQIVQPSATEAAQIGGTLGLEIPLQARTSSGFIRTLADINKKGIFSENLTKSFENFAKKVDETSQAVKSKFASEAGQLPIRDEAASNLGDLRGDVVLNQPKQALESAADAVESLRPVQPVNRFEIGDFIKKGFDDVVEAFEETKGKLYDEAAGKNTKEVQKAKIKASTSLQAAEDLISGFKKSLIGSPASELIRGLRRALKKPISLEALRQTTKELGAKLKGANDPVVTGAKAQLEKMYAAMKQDLDTGYSAISPEYKSAIDAANKFFKDSLTVINSDYGKAIDSLNAEQIYQKFIKPNNGTQISAVKELVPTLGDKLPAAVLTDVFTKSLDASGGFVPDKFFKSFDKFDGQTKSAIFSAEQIQRIDDVKKHYFEVKKILDETEAPTFNAPTKGSKQDMTALKNRQLAELDGLKRAVASASADTRFVKGFQLARNVGALAIGVNAPIALLATTFAYILGDAALSKILNSKMLDSIIKEGYKTPDVAKAFELINKNKDLFFTIANTNRGGEQQVEQSLRL